VRFGRKTSTLLVAVGLVVSSAACDTDGGGTPEDPATEIQEPEVGTGTEQDPLVPRDEELETDAP
jgi:hypothetical protein